MDDFDEARVNNLHLLTLLEETNEIGRRTKRRKKGRGKGKG